jgi:hypothetical protein
MQPEDLITYCGAFCGTCARCSRYTAFRDAARLLAELADAHGFQHWLPQETKDFDYAEFRKGLDFFANPDSWLVCKRGCRGGQGGPPWCVRECCREHQVDLCFECAEFPCSKVKENKPMMKRGEEYRKLGRSEWLHRQVEKANQGFEEHTGKYYRVYISGSSASS